MPDVLIPIANNGAPKQSHAWLRSLLPGRLQPFLRGVRKRWQLRGLELQEPYKSVFPFTQVSASKQWNLVELAAQIENLGIPGAIAECGVLDGGTAALMAYAARKSGRRIHLFDAWKGLPECTDEDGEAGKKWVGDVVGSPKRVTQIMKILEIAPERIYIHRGWFHETFPLANVPQVALVHVDCDFYEPTVLCLENWYPKLAPGGYIQIDDYDSYQGCRKAVDEFLAANPSVKLQLEGKHGDAYFFQKP